MDGHFVHFHSYRPFNQVQIGQSFLFIKITPKKVPYKQIQKYRLNTGNRKKSIRKWLKEEPILMLLIVIISDHSRIQPNHILGFYYDYQCNEKE